MIFMPMKEFLWATESQTQEMLGCKRGKLWQLRKEGIIHYAKIGRQTMYYLPSIEEMLMEMSTIKI